VLVVTGDSLTHGYNGSNSSHTSTHYCVCWLLQRCGKIRFGYDLGPDDKTLMPNPAEQQAVALMIVLMIDLRAAGCTLRQIAAALTQQGVRTKEGGTAWTHTAVARILQQKAA
jgi:hypothetical protein